MSERPKPLFEDAAAPEELRAFAERARADGPSQADLDRLAARIAAKLDVAGIVAPAATKLGSAPRDVPPAGDALLGAHTTLLRRLIRSTRARVAAAVGLSAAIGIGLWSAQRTPAEPAPAKAPVVTAAHAVAPASRPMEPELQGPPAAAARPPAPIVESENTVVEADGTPERARAHGRRSRAARHARAETRAPTRENEMVPKPSPAPPESPASELELIQQAEAARSNSSEALSLLARHEQLYPRGALAQEREALAIEVLLRAGQRERAHARAGRFVAAYPNSAHLPRVRALISRVDDE